MTMCPVCAMRSKLDALKTKHDLETVAAGLVLIDERKDRTIARIYKPMSQEHRTRLLTLLSEIDAAPTTGDT